MGGVRGVFLQWSPADTIRAADYTLKRLLSLGVQVQRGNRVERARDLVRQANLFNIQYDHRNRATEIAMAEAQRTIFEIFIIVKDLQPPSPLIRKNLRNILSAPDIPSAKGDDPGRDFQAELFAGAVFRAAGFHVDSGEPDLRIRRRTRVWGVAVKRVKSDKQFAMREAQRQLARQVLYGFIVVNPEIFLARAYLQDATTDLSAVLFEKTGDWVEYLDQNQNLDRVLAVVGLATSFKLVRLSSGHSFEFGLHIHYRFVTKGEPKQMAAIRVMSETMMSSLRNSFGNLRVPA